MPDLENDPEFKRWKARIKRDLVPMIGSSSACISIVPTGGEPDIKFAVELGLMIMMGKPILTVITPGSVCPPKLAAVSDMIIECDITTREGHDQIDLALRDFTEMFAPHDDEPDGPDV